MGDSTKLDSGIFSTKAAQDIAREAFGQNGELHVLDGDRDQNFLVTGKAGPTAILKITYAHEPSGNAIAQNAVMKRLAASNTDLAVSEPLATKDGAYIHHVVDQAGRQRQVRCLSFVAGRFLIETDRTRPGLMESLGEAVGQLTIGLTGFDHPGAHRDLVWNIANLTEVRKRLSALAEDQQVRIGAIFEAADAVLTEHGNDLRMGVIHGDLNDHNVLVDESGSGRVTGVIDFGDMVYAPVVCDLAIACAYAMMNLENPMAAASRIVAAYHRVCPLRTSEIAVLYPLIRARLAMTVTNAAFLSKEKPNDPYISISEAPAWDLLSLLDEEHPRFAHYRLRRACGLNAHPTTAMFHRWAKENAHIFKSTSQFALRTTDKLIFDFSNMDQPPKTATPEAFDTFVFSSMDKAGATVGVGRYDEARGLYQSQVFLGDGADEPRTVHLGIDIFEPAQAPVSALYAGTVHSFADNANPLDYGPTIVLRHEAEMGSVVFYTIYGHLARRSLDGLYPGKPIAAGEVFAWLGEASENGGWPPHLHFQISFDLLDKQGDFPGVCKASERAIWCDLCPDPNLLLDMPPECFGFEGESSEAIHAFRERHLSANLSLSYREPLYIVRGRGSYLFDLTGRAYLDCVNNVCHVGHCHPHVVAAASQQLSTLNTNTRYLHPEITRYTSRLLATFPDPLSVCFLVCTGSEANELALRMARTATGRTDVLVQDGGYHGNTSALVDLSPYKHDGPGGGGRPDYVHAVPMPDQYRGQFGYDDPDAGKNYAAEVTKVLEVLAEDGRSPAAFFAEPLLGCGGQIIPPAGYLRTAFEAVRAAGGVAIADEVQIGFGRVGSHFWGFQTQDAMPDIVTMGKPIGNGFPLAAVVTTPAIARAFHTGMEYFNTFGGNPVACAVGNAVLDVIEDQALQTNAARVGELLLDGFRELHARYEVIGDVRGAGLYLGIELVRNRETKEPAEHLASDLVNAMKERGILLSTDGPLHNVIKIKPPIVFDESQARLLLDALDIVFSEMAI